MRNWLVFGLLSLILCSCSTDVDLYADYKEIPVVYGLINTYADTNYVKITKAYCGNNNNPIDANAVAQVYDSSNYKEKLEAFIVELKSIQGRPFRPTGRKFYLDTITVHNKEEGVFYAPHQTLYYTTEHFNVSQGDEKYHYRINVVTPNHDIVSAETGIVGGDVSVGQTVVNFQSAPTQAPAKLVFTSTEEAVLYEIGMQFNYRERHLGQAEELKEVSWSYGARTLSQYEKVEGVDNIYRLYYSVNALFNVMERAIGNDTVWDENHPHVVRYIDDFTVFIAAAGENFNNYYQYLQTTQNGLSLSSEYTNVEGGLGLFSSRIFVRRKVNLSALAKFDLFQKPWGFQEQ